MSKLKLYNGHTLAEVLELIAMVKENRAAGPGPLLSVNIISEDGLIAILEYMEDQYENDHGLDMIDLL